MNLFGFRIAHSISHALIDLTSDVYDSIDKNYKSCNIFTNLTKAFDTVDHTILFHKLHFYGFRGIAYELVYRDVDFDSKNRMEWISKRIE